jgi:hypothetical protein
MFTVAHVGTNVRTPTGDFNGLRGRAPVRTLVPQYSVLRRARSRRRLDLGGPHGGLA